MSIDGTGMKSLFFFLVIAIGLLSAQCGGAIDVRKGGDCEKIDPPKFRNLAVHYLLKSHPEMVAYINDAVPWKGGRITLEGLLGHETYRYSGDGWTATVEWNVVPQPVYEITLSYNRGQIVWKANLYVDCEIRETNFTMTFE